MHMKIEREIYIKDKTYFFEFIKSKTSYENAEKVVKEPKRPIIKKNLIKFSDKLFPKSYVIKYPIKKEPITLTDMVP